MSGGVSVVPLPKTKENSKGKHLAKALRRRRKKKKSKSAATTDTGKQYENMS
jgi:hypothetical protein